MAFRREHYDMRSVSVPVYLFVSHYVCIARPIFFSEIHWFKDQLAGAGVIPQADTIKIKSLLQLDLCMELLEVLLYIFIHMF